MAYNPATGRNNSLVGGGGFNRFSAGGKRYGAGRMAPNQGKTANMTGYATRDIKNEARKNALLKRAGRI